MKLFKKKEKQYILKYEEYNANPIKRGVSDCFIRGCVLFLDASWDDTFDKLAVLAKEFRTVLVDASLHDAFLENNNCIRTHSDKKTLLGNFEKFNIGKYLVQVAYSNESNHIVYVKDGVVYDSYDSRKYKVIEYWEIKEEYE